jgi:hypothetical protein
MNEYCYRIDSGDLQGFARLFEHGTFEVIGDPEGPYLGTDAVLGMLENVTLYDGKPHSKHVMSNVQIDVGESGDTATAQCYITVFQAVPGFPLQPIFIGHYRDEFERVGSEWRFRKRSISPDLIGDLSHHRADMA